MLANKEYNAQLNEVVDILLDFAKSDKSPYLKINKNTNKKLFIIISSTLGLCGSYNNNIFKVSDANVSKDDDAIILGEKGIAHYENGEFKVIEGFNDDYSVDNKDSIKKITNFIFKEYEKGTYSEIHIIYSEYKNSLVFLAKDYMLLPLKYEDKEVDDYAPIFEPSGKELVDTLLPFYIQSALYAKLLESEVCEQGARSNAMENATNNAKDLLNDLNIEFNKARQAAITQEITEIVAASKAV